MNIILIGMPGSGKSNVGVDEVADFVGRGRHHIARRVTRELVENPHQQFSQ